MSCYTRHSLREYGSYSQQTDAHELPSAPENHHIESETLTDGNDDCSETLTDGNDDCSETLTDGNDDCSETLTDGNDDCSELLTQCYSQ